MFKKIVGLIIVIVLFCGSICGIVYGVKYSKYDNSQAEVIEQKDYQISVLERQLQQLAEERQQIIADNTLTLEEKNQKISELEAQIAVLKQQSSGEIDIPEDGIILTLNPRLAPDSSGIITFTYNEFILTNEKRCFAFDYSIGGEYRVSAVTCTASVGIEYLNGVCVVYLGEENLAKSEQCYIDFSLVKVSTAAPAIPL